MSKFAFAQLKGDVCLVQVSDESSSSSSSLMVSEVKVFRHEFITIFRYSHHMCVHPADLRILCTVDERCALHDEEKETVYLSKDVMAHLQRLVAASSKQQYVRRSRVVAPARSMRVPGGPMTRAAPARHVTLMGQ